MAIEDGKPKPAAAPEQHRPVEVPMPPTIIVPPGEPYTSGGIVYSDQGYSYSSRNPDGTFVPPSKRRGDPFLNPFFTV